MYQVCHEENTGELDDEELSVGENIRLGRYNTEHLHFFCVAKKKLSAIKGRCHVAIMSVMSY